MKNINSLSKPLILFYALTLYIVIQFAWWSYMLAKLNEEIYSKKIELILTQKKFEKENYTEIKLLEKKLLNKKMMIFGEGGVFIIILILGLYITKKSISKELKLAEQQKNFLLSITHELKSPVATIKLYLQTLIKRELETSKKLEILNNSIKETDRLNNLIDNLLVASKIDSKLFNLQFENTNLKEFTDSTLENFKNLYSHKYHFITDIDNSINISVDKQAFSSIILNLVENAIKYSPLNSEIRIESFKTADNKIQIRFIDQGIGIADTEKNMVFERFYRIGSEDTRSSKGTGLGLYIVKNLVLKHGGQINILNNSPKGSIFELKF